MTTDDFGRDPYHAIFENTHTVMMIIDPADGRIVDANARAAEFYGWPRETLTTMCITEINTLPPEQVVAEMALARRERRDHFNFKHRLASGRVRDVEVYSGPIDLAGRQLLYSIVRDVTQRLEMERTLSFLARRASYLLELPQLADTLGEAELMQRGLDMAEDLTQSVISFIHFVNEDENTIELVTWSHRTLETYCHAAYDRHYPVDQAGIWAEALRQRQPVVFNDYATAPGKHGLPEGHAHLERLISLPVIELGKVVMLVGVGNKPSHYTQSEVETLQLVANSLWYLINRNRTQGRLARFSRLLEGSANEIYTFDADTYRFVDVSRGACQNLGYRLEEMRQMTPFDIKPELTREALLDLFEPLRSGKNRDVSFITRHRRRDGSTYPIELHVELLEEVHPLYVAVGRDISQRLRNEQALRDAYEYQRQLNQRLEAMQGQLLQSEKMASIGQLAAGVAHELNNPIGFVSSNLGSLESYLTDLFAILDAYALAEVNEQACCPQLDQARQLKRDKDYDFLRSDIVQLLDESREGLGRVAKIIKDLKDFSRAGEAQMQWANLHQGLDSTLNVVWNELKYKCTVRKDYGELPEVWCEPSQLNQVFMNLLVNAGHAIAEKGEITITTGQQGNEVFVAIRDTGSGIPPENLNRIFDPFFTTKPVGKGTGLGLSLSYGIVQKHHGRIDVESSIGQGTTFTVWLPIEPPANAESA